MWWHPAGGADLDPLRVNGGHGVFDGSALLLLLAVKPTLITGLLWWFVEAVDPVRHGAEFEEISQLVSVVSAKIPQLRNAVELLHWRR